MEKCNIVIVAQICNETSTASQVRPQRVKVGRQYRDPTEERYTDPCKEYSSNKDLKVIPSPFVIILYCFVWGQAALVGK